jgi:endoglycosylceramidase
MRTARGVALTKSALAVFVAAIAVSSVSGPHPLAATPLPTLTHAGRWLTDPEGRVVVLHGLQVDRFRRTAPINFVDLNPANVSFMADNGFNLARVSLSYAGVEPAPGRYDNTYIDSYRALDQQLAAAGVYDLPDLQQGQFSASLAGNGFPDWMAMTDGLPNTRSPFPQSYLINPAEERAWDHFWANAPAADGIGLVDHYAAGLAYVARRFGNAPGLLGFEFLNEPWPGTPWPTCASPVGCPPAIGFDQTALTAFNHRLVAALRSADPNHLIVYEPNLLFDYGAATGVGAGGDLAALFGFHNYCLGNSPGLTNFDPGGSCGIEEQLVISNAEAQGRRTGDGLLMDEWGNTADTAMIRRITAEADQAMMGWSYWALEDCCRSVGAVLREGAKPPGAPGNLNAPVLSALVRAYPRVIAGTPTGWGYDPSTRRFHLTYNTTLLSGRTAAGMVTEVFVPSLQFGAGYGVAVTGAEVAGGLGTQHLLLRNCPGAPSVEVTVTAVPTTALPSCSEQEAAAQVVRSGSASLPNTSR